MENYGKTVIKIAAILTAVILLSNIVLLPALIIFGPIVMPLAKAMEFTADVSLFFHRVFNFITGNQNYKPTNESYSYNWEMGAYAKTISFSQVIKALLFHPLRATNIPLGSPIIASNFVYSFLDTSFIPASAFYEEIDRQVVVDKDGNVIPGGDGKIKENNLGIDTTESDAGVAAQLPGSTEGQGENSDIWRNQVKDIQENYVNGVLFNSDGYLSQSYEDKSEEALWASGGNGDDFYKQLDIKWENEKKKFEDWCASQKHWLDVNGDGIQQSDEIFTDNPKSEKKKVITDFQLNVIWVYSPIEGWCLKKYGIGPEVEVPIDTKKALSVKVLGPTILNLYEGGTFDAMVIGGKEPYTIKWEVPDVQILKNNGSYEINCSWLGKFGDSHTVMVSVTDAVGTTVSDALTVAITNGNSYNMSLIGPSSAKVGDVVVIGISPSCELYVNSSNSIEWSSDGKAGSLGKYIQKYQWTTSGQKTVVVRYLGVDGFVQSTVSLKINIKSSGDPAENNPDNRVYPAIGTAENLIYLPKDGFHIYAGGEMIDPNTYDHRYVGVVLTGLRSTSSESLDEQVKKDGIDDVLKQYYDFTNKELEKMNDQNKQDYLHSIQTNDTTDSYAVKIEGKPFAKDKLEFWLQDIYDRTGDDKLGNLISDLQFSNLLDNDGFFYRLTEKGINPYNVDPLLRGRVYTDKDGDMFKDYDFFQPARGTNAPTPLFLTETSHKSQALSTYYFAATYEEPYLYTYTYQVPDPNDPSKTITVTATAVGWQDKDYGDVPLDFKDHVWGPNSSGGAASQEADCSFLKGNPYCPTCYDNCIKNNQELEKQAKKEWAHENHGDTFFPLYYKILLVGQGAENKFTDQKQEEQFYDDVITANLLTGQEQLLFDPITGTPYYVTMPLDPQSFMSSQVEFLGYSEGGQKDAPTQVVYPPADITSAVPYGNPVISGCISSPFGWRTYPVNEFHLGIDIGIIEGTSVYSTMNGIVNFAGWLGGYGYLVIIVSRDDSQWYATKYAHLSQIEVQQGQQITRGQEIAKSGNTGFSTGSHLHYEVHAGTSLESVLSGNTAQNPEQWGASYSHCP